MTTLSQIANSDEIWSLEDDDGALFLHYETDTARTVIPITRDVLVKMADQLELL